MKRWALIVVVALLSVGWLVPLSAAVDCLVTWCEHEETDAHGQHSFPYLAFARDAFALAWVWIAVVGLFWSVTAGRRCLVKTS